eukprot:Colp12_sorted_trinity150504_noHs@16384
MDIDDVSEEESVLFSTSAFRKRNTMSNKKEVDDVSKYSIGRRVNSKTAANLKSEDESDSEESDTNITLNIDSNPTDSEAEDDDYETARLGAEDESQDSQDVEEEEDEDRPMLRSTSAPNLVLDDDAHDDSESELPPVGEVLGAEPTRVEIKETVVIQKNEWEFDLADDRSLDAFHNNRYYLPQSGGGARIVCYNCSETGHMSRDCTNARKEYPCVLCGLGSHRLRECPADLCHRCSLPGHHSYECRKPRRYPPCQRCASTAHDVTECDENWRQYHNSVTSEINPISHPNSRKHCFVCAGAHYGHVCALRKDSYYEIVSPFMNTYDTERTAPKYSRKDRRQSHERGREYASSLDRKEKKDKREKSKGRNEDRRESFPKKENKKEKNFNTPQRETHAEPLGEFVPLDGSKKDGKKKKEKKSKKSESYNKKSHGGSGSNPHGSSKGKGEKRKHSEWEGERSDDVKRFKAMNHGGYHDSPREGGNARGFYSSPKNSGKKKGKSSTKPERGNYDRHTFPKKNKHGNRG